MQAGGQRADMSFGDDSDDSKRLLLEIMLLYEQALCRWQLVDSFVQKSDALVVVCLQHAVGLIVRNGL